jgi:acetolactate synthase-1/2/3 large subunit
MKIKCSDLVASFLAEKQVTTTFGITGSAIAHVFDSIGNLSKTEIICVHHEQAACMAAQGYFRTHGTPTVAIVTAGGGSSNAITGVLSAWMDSLPLLVISGNENAKFTYEDNPLRIWGVQGYDSTTMVQKITKHVVRVMDPAMIVYELEKAWHIATTGRPGPVWMDIPMSVQGSLIEEEDIKRYVPAAAPAAGVADKLSQQLDVVVDLLRHAKRPVLWLGNGIRHAGFAPQLPVFFQQIQVPSLVTWAMIDALDAQHPLNFGRAGLYGQRSANFVLQNADLLITIGTRMPLQQVGYDISELARTAKIVVVDIDEKELAKYVQRYDVSICSDAGDFMRGLAEALGRYTAPPEWVATCNDFRSRYPIIGPEHDDIDDFINSYRFMERLNRHFHEDQVVCTDAGTALLSGHQVLQMKPGQMLFTSLGLGEMGYGLPAAIGAAFGRGRKEVLCLNCDGGMMMNLQELQTIVHHKLPVKIIIFNNDGYLMIKHTQNAMFKGRRYGVDERSGVSCPNFSKVAGAFDIKAFQINVWADVDPVLEQLQQYQGPAICEVRMHPNQMMLPKLSLAIRADGSLVSPPLEDLSPLLSRAELERNMLIGMHEKSKQLKPS